MKKIFVFASSLFFMVGIANVVVPCCAAMDAVILAEVNGETIEESALQERIRKIHKYMPQNRVAGDAGGINIMDIVEKMIDERLMIQEAYRVELNKTADFKRKIERFITTQSILRLRKDEVLDKICVSEKDLIDYFRNHYEKDVTAPEVTFNKVKRRIEKRLRKAREKELSDNFIAGLQEKADIWVDKDLVDLLEPEKNYTGKKSIVARVNGEAIPLNDFLYDLKQTKPRRMIMLRRIKDKDQIQKIYREIKQSVVESLIRFKLIEQEALRRKYVNDPAFMDIVKKREKRLLVTEFKAETVYPLSIPTKNELTQYYEKHIDDFKKGYEVWFNEMVFQQREYAQNALDELKQGADFQFLAARLSEKWMPRKKAVWVNANSLSPAIREELNRLGVGQTSDVISDSKQYKIIKLKGKKGGEPVEFSRIVDTLKKIVGQKNFNKVLSKYLAKLRGVSTIKVNKNALKHIEKKFWKESREKKQNTG